MSDLPLGRRTTVRWRNQPVELLRSADGVRARSLVCTHMSCIVRWDGDAARYLCPCHDGAFDADGRPAAGPPLRPLRAIPVMLIDGQVRLSDAPEARTG